MSELEKRVCDKIMRRAEFGLEKYGVSVGERRDLDVFAWLNHLQEELMDACVYIERLWRDLEGDK